MNMLEGCRDRSLAGGLEWLNPPAQWGVGPGGLAVELSVACDFFRPYSGEAHDNAHLLHAPHCGHLEKARDHIVGLLTLQPLRR